MPRSGTFGAMPAGKTWIDLVAPRSVLRERHGHAEPVVGPIELFFDLVYVFAIIQLSHYLLEHGTWAGALEAATLFLAVWWAWNYSAWAMNWLSPDSAPVRLLLAALMVFGLGMAVAIPEAFADRGGLFAGAVVCLQLVRSAYLIVAFRGRDEAMQRNYQQLFAWSAAAGVFWIVGAAADSDARVWLWLLAVAVDYAGPLVNFWVPGRGRRPIEGWSLVPSHLAERNRLVLIIALGESILVMGGTLSDHELTRGAVVAAFVGFAVLFLLWWIYFDPSVEEATEVTGAAVGRNAFAYAHALMVAGAIVVAVAIEQVIAHPSGQLARITLLTGLGGPVLYLAGNLDFVAAHGVRRLLPRVTGIVALLAALGILWAIGDDVSPPVALVVPAAILAAVAGALRVRPSPG